jgi:hypothetical protein
LINQNPKLRAASNDSTTFPSSFANLEDQVMKIPARHYRITLLCLLLVLSGFTIYAHKALDATRGNQAGLLERLVGGPKATARPAPSSKKSGSLVATAVTMTSAAALTNDFFTATSEPFDPALAPAQAGGTFNITQAVLPGGGGTSNGGTHSVTGTLGQGLTATSTGGSFTVASGFFGGGGGCSPLTVTPPATNTGTIGANFSQQFTQAGGSGTVNFTTASTLPTGLTLATSGLLSGLPTQTGTFPMTVTATDSNQCTGTANYTLTINCQTITVNLPGTNTGTAGLFFSQTFTQTGGLGTVNFTLNAGTLPSGIGLAANGTLSGTTAQTGSFPLTVKATDANGCLGVSASYTLVINPPSCPTITVNPASATLPVGRAGTPYNQTFTQTGGAGTATFSVSAGSLPTGLTLSTGGALAGTPTVNGTFNFTVRATDQNNCMGERAYTLLLNPPCTTITLNPATLPNGTVGTAYNQTLTASGGTAPHTFAVTTGSLPNGLNLATSGALTGTPTASGSFNFTVTATDNTGCTGTRSYTVIISGTGLQFYPLPAPVRLLDTRAGEIACTQPSAPIAGQTSLTQMGRGLCNIPANAVALTGNLTTVQSGGGYLTLYPSNAPQPTVASTNYNANEIINNVFTVGLGPDGAFKIFAFFTTEVVVDVTGYYAPPAANGLYFHPLPKPIRLLETRAGEVGCNTPGAPIQGGAAGTRTQQARLTCDGVTIPAGALAIVGNATTVGPQAGGYLTLFPANAAQPLAASSNYNAGQVVNGPFSVGLAPTGEFNIFTFATTHLVVDVLGYYSTEANDVNGAGLLFNPLPKPVRLLETRANQAVGCYLPGLPLISGVENTQPARGACDGVTIPANALGVVGNATVVTPNAAGFLTLWPSTALRPLVATANYNAGDIGNRHFIVGLGAGDGAFKLFSSATTELVVDLSGYFAP